MDILQVRKQDILIFKLKLSGCSVKVEIRIIWHYEGDNMIILVDVGIRQKSNIWRKTLTGSSTVAFGSKAWF